jgi:hypothetical protein
VHARLRDSQFFAAVAVDDRRLLKQRRRVDQVLVELVTEADGHGCGACRGEQLRERCALLESLERDVEAALLAVEEATHALFEIAVPVFRSRHREHGVLGFPGT